MSTLQPLARLAMLCFWLPALSLTGCNQYRNADFVVTDADTGQPVANASLVVGPEAFMDFFAPRRAEGRTNDLGIVRLRVGDYRRDRLYINALGYEPTSYSFAGPGRSSSDLDDIHPSPEWNNSRYGIATIPSPLKRASYPTVAVVVPDQFRGLIVVIKWPERAFAPQPDGLLLQKVALSAGGVAHIPGGDGATNTRLVFLSPSGLQIGSGNSSDDDCSVTPFEHNVNGTDLLMAHRVGGRALADRAHDLFRSDVRSGRMFDQRYADQVLGSVREQGPPLTFADLLDIRNRVPRDYTDPCPRQ